MNDYEGHGMEKGLVVTAMDNNNVALVFWTRLVFFFFPGAILVWAWILLGCLG